MHDWYEQKQKDYESWAKIYPVTLIEENFKKIDKQKAWCELAEVAATPTLLVNGYKLPNIYQLPDLRYMLEQMVQQYNNYDSVIKLLLDTL